VQTFIWRNYRFELPDDWEMLQFTRNPQVGRCAFADRRQFRFEMNWRTVSALPDFDRMLADYQSRLEEEGLAETRRLEHHRWQGVSGREERRLTTRYGRYFPEDKSLLEVVFLWPKDRDVALEKRILDSFFLELPADGLAHWRAFGMDFHVSASHDFWKAYAQPTSMQLKFTAQKGYREQRFARFGMVDEWLGTNPGVWLRTWIPRGFRLDQQTRHIRDGHEIFTIKGLRKLPTAKDWFRGRREIKASAWICPQHKRLYSLLLVSTGRVVDQESRIGLRCCEHMEVKP
jgi:hypothetical protein